MDMKKSWDKCVLALIFGVVTVLYFIALCDWGFSFKHLGPISIATLLFLLGVTIYFCMECFAPEHGKWPLIITGIITLVLIIIAFCNVADTLKVWSFAAITSTFLVPLAIYALLPLILGIKRLQTKD